MGRQEGMVVKPLPNPGSSLGKDSPKHLASLPPPHTCKVEGVGITIFQQHKVAVRSKW